MRNTARSEMTLGASTWASKRREVSSVSGGCSSCIRLLPVGDNVVNRYSACVEPALLYAVTRSSYLVPLSRFTMENLDCGCTLFETATELGSLRETDRDDALGVGVGGKYPGDNFPFEAFEIFYTFYRKYFPLPFRIDRSTRKAKRGKN